MGDLALAFVFGGAVCLYLAAGDSPAGLAGCGLVLVFLTLIKDIGLAYALVAVLVMALARAFGQKPVRLRRVFTTAGQALVAAVLIAGAFVLWSVYVMQASGVDKNAVGGEGESVGYATVLLGGLAQLLGIGRTEKFSAILALMLKAPFTCRSVCWGRVWWPWPPRWWPRAPRPSAPRRAPPPPGAVDQRRAVDRAGRVLGVPSVSVCVQLCGY